MIGFIVLVVIVAFIGLVRMARLERRVDGLESEVAWLQAKHWPGDEHLGEAVVLLPDGLPLAKGGVCSAFPMGVDTREGEG